MSKFGRKKQWTVALLSVLLIVLVTLSSSAMVDTSDGTGTPVFGCPADEPVVIANVDCRLGVADAFDQPARHAATGAPSDPSIAGGAPWCGDTPDLTIYGCAVEPFAPVLQLPTSKR